MARAATNRAEILDAALELFETRGFDETTCEAIAESAGISPRTFYRYFDSKIELVLAAAGGEGEAGPLGKLVVARPPDEHPARALLEVMRGEAPPTSADDPRARQQRILMSTPSLSGVRYERFHLRQAHLARAFAMRLDRDIDDPLVQMLAAAAVTCLLNSFERWVEDGAGEAELWPAVEAALTLLERQFVLPAGN